MDKDIILDSFVIYRSFHESLNKLPIEQYGRMVKAILEFGLYGTKPEFNNPIESALWTAFEHGVEQSRNISISRRTANAMRKAYKGGAPINNKNATKQQQNDDVVSETTTKQQQNNNKTTTLGSKEIRSKEIRSKDKEKTLEKESEFGNSQRESPDETNVYDSIENDTTKNSPKQPKTTQRFVKPTVEQINSYISEKGYHFTGEAFFDFYESKGWMVGSNHMKDWKAACRTWESKRKAETQTQKQTASDEFPAGLNAEKWKQAKDWMTKYTPRIMPDIDPDLFLTLRAIAHRKVDIFMEMMEEMDKSGFSGNYKEEFQRLAWTEKYFKRIMA